MTDPPDRPLGAGGSDAPGDDVDPDHVTTPGERIIALAAMLFVLVAVAAVGFTAVDKYVYVSDDARLGALLSPNNRETDRPIPEHKVREICFELSSQEGYSAGRANRHFLYGCSGVWPGPPSGD